MHVNFCTIETYIWEKKDWKDINQNASCTLLAYTMLYVNFISVKMILLFLKS